LSGLQTPKLKRLAEIVSAQAIQQQEKLDYDMNGNGMILEHQSLEIDEIEAGM
jgi:hypothetical protein